MNRNIRRDITQTKLAYREMSAAMKPLAAMALAGGLTASLKGALGEGAEYQHELSMLRVAGRTAKEVSQAIAQANKTMLAVPTSTLNENLKILNETTLAYGNFGHALENLTFNQKMGSMLHNMIGDKAGDSGEMFNNLIRGMEIRGSALDHTRYQREASELFKAMVATGGTVNPEAILGFVQQANPAVRGYSERFFTKIVPSLIQEFGGERAGTGLTAFNNQILGRVGVGGKSITNEWVRLGLVPPNGTGGNLSKSGWTPGALRGTGLAMSDPFKWAEEILLPAMAKAGINIQDEKAVGLESKRLFGRETGARIASTLLSPQQRARLHKDEGLFNKAMGPDKAFAEAMKNDPKMAWASTAASLKNLETILGRAVTPQVIAGLQSMAGAINWIAGAFDQHPMFAKGAMALLGFGAAAATLKVFEISLRRLVIGPIKSLIGFGPAIGRGLMAIAPWILRGLAVAFEVVSGPVGWAMLAAAAAGLVYAYRDQIAGAWHALTGWFTNSAWPAIAATFAPAMDWGSSVVNGLITSLSSAWPRLKAWFANAWANVAPTWLGGSPAPVAAAAGAPAPVMPAAGRGGVRGGAAAHGPVTIHVNGAGDPHAVAAAVDRRLAHHARKQSAALND